MRELHMLDPWNQVIFDNGILFVLEKSSLTDRSLTGSMLLAMLITIMKLYEKHISCFFFLLRYFLFFLPSPHIGVRIMDGSASPTLKPDPSCCPSTDRTNPDTDHNGYYAGYADLETHEVMLKDWQRNRSYRRFFEEHRHLVADRVVMDVGAGTGLLSLFAASAGARKVYAVEATDVAEVCRRVVRRNNFDDRIEVIHSAVEDVRLGDVKVDVIVSEWMGFYLLHESMLESVIIARDLFLADNGIMVPSAASIILAPVTMSGIFEDRYDFYDNICGFDLSSVKAFLHQQLTKKPLIIQLGADNIASTPQEVHRFNLQTVRVDQVCRVSRCVTFHMPKDTYVHGFALWFHAYFTPHIMSKDPVQSVNDSGMCGVSQDHHSGQSYPEPIILNTSPTSPETHWKQTVIVLPEAVHTEMTDHIRCSVSLTQDSGNKRRYNIDIELTDHDEDISESSEEEHPLPCECGRTRCRLVKQVMERYVEEHDAVDSGSEMCGITTEGNVRDCLLA